MVKSSLLLLLLASPVCVSGLARNRDDDASRVVPRKYRYGMGHEGDAPGWFEVVFEVALRGQASGSKDSSQFTVRVHPDWAPLGAARFKELVEQGFYDDSGVFQVLRGVVAAFGLPAKPQPELMRIADDNATHPNVRGTLSFTRERSSKIVINLADNNFLNNKGFAPFGEVMADGMDVVERFYSGYADHVDEERLFAEGNAYPDAAFPLTTTIVKVFLKQPPSGARQAEAPPQEEDEARLGGEATIGWD